MSRLVNQNNKKENPIIVFLILTLIGIFAYGIFSNNKSSNTNSPQQNTNNIKEKEENQNDYKASPKKNCSAYEAQQFVTNRFESIGTQILQGPGLSFKDMDNCKFVFGIVVMSKYGTVEGCEIVVGFDGNNYTVTSAACK